MIPRLFIVDDEEPARRRLRMLLEDIAAECPHELAGEAATAQQALDGVARTAPDIVLLDVQMPGMSGIELASRLNRVPAGMAPPAVIFITAHDGHALSAFEVQALDYLLKPVRAARLAQAIGRAAGMRAVPAQHAPAAGAASGRRHFSVPERGRVLLVPVADAVYLKAEQKYVTLRTRSREYLIEESLTALEEEFAASLIRVHRNALVARDAIIGVERAMHAADAEADERGQEAWQVILRGVDERLPISRRQWSAVRALVR